MLNVCTPILVNVASPISEILLFFVFYSNFIFAYSPWGQKIESVKENIS